MGQRGGFDGHGEHEASRRMKTELLIQMDGLAKSDDLVFVLAASNIPWDLDLALLRRLEKRVMVPLPEAPARSAMLTGMLGPRVEQAVEGAEQTLVDFDAIAERCPGYSGSDLKQVCKEAAMAPVRRLMTELEAIDRKAAHKHPTGPHSSIQASLQQQQDVMVKIGTVTVADVDASLGNTKATSAKYEEKYQQWNKDFGSS